MLVLSRRPSECVEIVVPPTDQPTRILVCYVSPKRFPHVRIGFEAPSEVRIFRQEILQDLTQCRNNPSPQSTPADCG